MNAGFDSCHLEFRETATNPDLDRLAAEVKAMGRRLAPHGLSREAYIEKNSTLSILFIIDVQKWKGLYFGKRGDFLQLDTPESMAATLYDFFMQTSDYEKIQTLRRITRLGQTVNTQMERYELKKASILAQFLDPKEWGLLDWSTMRSSHYPDRPNRLFFEPVSELVVRRSLEFIRSKRCMAYPEAMDVGLALFSGSLD